MEKEKIDAKQFLRQYQNILVDIRNMEAEVEELESMAMSATGHVEMANIEKHNKKGEKYTMRSVMERVQSSGSGDKMSNLAAKICDMEIEIMDRRTRALDKLREIRAVIEQVENKDYKQLLHRRYIEGNTWEQIAVDMHYSYRGITKMHGRALPEVDKILNCS